MVSLWYHQGDLIRPSSAAGSRHESAVSVAVDMLH